MTVFVPLPKVLFRCQGILLSGRGTGTSGRGTACVDMFRLCHTDILDRLVHNVHRLSRVNPWGKKPINRQWKSPKKEVKNQPEKLSSRLNTQMRTADRTSLPGRAVFFKVVVGVPGRKATVRRCTCCIHDEGRSLGFADQVVIPNHPEQLPLRAVVVSIQGKGEMNFVR